MDVVVALRIFSRIPLELRLLDVCPGCGQGAFSDVSERLKWLAIGGKIRCVWCAIEKDLEAPAIDGSGSVLASQRPQHDVANAPLGAERGPLLLF